MAQAGIARTFQNLRLFNEMSVLENVMVGCHVRTRNGLWAAIARHRRAGEEEQAVRDKSHALLEYVGIGQFAHYRAGDLAYGHQRRTRSPARWRPNPGCWRWTNRRPA